jgi:hypothetical protein
MTDRLQFWQKHLRALSDADLLSITGFVDTSHPHCQGFLTIGEMGPTHCVGTTANVLFASMRHVSDANRRSIIT